MESPPQLCDVNPRAVCDVNQVRSGDLRPGSRRHRRSRSRALSKTVATAWSSGWSVGTRGHLPRVPRAPTWERAAGGGCGASTRPHGPDTARRTGQDADRGGTRGRRRPSAQRPGEEPASAGSPPRPPSVSRGTPVQGRRRETTAGQRAECGTQLPRNRWAGEGGILSPLRDLRIFGKGLTGLDCVVLPQSPPCGEVQTMTMTEVIWRLQLPYLWYMSCILGNTDLLELSPTRAFLIVYILLLNHCSLSNSDMLRIL
ncbi:uncharacterized protein LOC119867367 isoform X1 [Canis lupus familiaris]|uniref:uncharacterized protein LOC119867367 isoform X1 n=1 Tax=Canis lupus familiaris TaxID=9615 RepID=UPI0018F7E30C|nr:uncharacterized protein LOC119867367 isoform X1 [Canis lupus familiaris]